MKKYSKKAFTLIELLIVIAIIAIIATVVFVALDPLTRFQDARDSSRWSDVSALISAIKVNQIDNGGNYATVITGMTSGDVYMLGTCASGSTLAAVTDYCDTNPTKSPCIDLSSLVTGGYLASIPVSPDGSGTWTSAFTGYTLERQTSGILYVRACESENSDEIFVGR